MSEFNVEWGVIMATGMLLAIPPIIFTLFASRQIITGMTAGAVKGCCMRSQGKRISKILQQ